MEKRPRNKYTFEQDNVSYITYLKLSCSTLSPGTYILDKRAMWTAEFIQIERMRRKGERKER